MASPTQIEFLKVLACIAWADEELTKSEINVIKALMREFQLTGDQWLEVEMYLDEKVGAEETRRVLRRFLGRVRRPAERQRLVNTVEEMLGNEEHLAAAQREWIRELRDAVAESSGGFLLDGLRSLLRIGAGTMEPAADSREAQFHDFIHNRVLFKLRHRVGAENLARAGTPEKLKELTLCAAFLGHVGYVDQEFLPEEKAFIKRWLRDTWAISPSMAEAVCEVAMEAVSRGLDLYPLMNEANAVLSLARRKLLIEALFALSVVAGTMSGDKLEEIRKIAFRLGFMHREFIGAKLKALGKD